jgi:sulfoxide reductase heme-binding subunit YedZ
MASKATDWLDRTRFSKALIFVNALVPLAYGIWDAAHGQLGANPIEFITRTTGTLTLVFLLLTLAVTPARKLFGLPWLVKIRRMLGLFTFFYGALHFLTYLWLDQFFAIGAILTDALTRPFVAVGLIAFSLMVPLAWTSTNAAVKRMGGKRWQKLHRYTYHVAILGIIHYWLLVKADKTGPIIFGALAGVLLGWRLWVFLNQKRSEPEPAAPPGGESP